MKIYLIILILITLIISGCSSSPRFSSENDNTTNNRYKKEEKESTGDIRIKKETSRKALDKVTGVASFYSEKFHGKKTASGEIYDMYDLTAAHETYPFNTIVRVVNLKNNKSVVLRINDRKPDLNGRIIDISYKAAQELDMVINGIAHVRVEVLEWGK